MTQNEYLSEKAISTHRSGVERPRMFLIVSSPPQMSRALELAEKYSENLSVCKVDVDANRELALQYNVRSIPSLMIFKNGEMVDSLIGAVSLEELEDLVTRNF